MDTNSNKTLLLNSRQVQHIATYYVVHTKYYNIIIYTFKYT